MKIARFLLTFVTSTLMLTACGDMNVKSPDGRIIFNLELTDDGAVEYGLKVDGEAVMANSAMGFELADGAMLSNGFEVVGTARDSRNETWEQVWGESRYVVNNYNELLVELKNATDLRMDVRIRVFDDGFGFRYEFPEQEGAGEFRIMDELTTFNFTQAHQAWWISREVYPYYEGYGKKSGFDEIDVAYTPITIEGADGRFYAIHEAALLDYAKMNLIPQGECGLKADLVAWKDGTKVYASTPSVTPWRMMIVSDNVGGLMESKLMLNLNEPSKIEDTSWIKPGKYIGIWWELHKDEYTWYSGPRHGATTERTMKYIDFAAENGIEGVLVEGWNLGWDGNWMKNSTGFDFVKAYPDYDFDKIMAYARSKGVQMIIHNETAANIEHYFTQIDEAYALYQKSGMHYIKTGNVNLYIDGKEEHDGQYGVNKLHSIVEKAAEYQICVDEHEPVIPTGVGRTWPNLMTHEAVRGQEHDVRDLNETMGGESYGGNIPEHTTIIPFIRGLAGPSDFTFGTFNFENPNFPYSRVQTTLAKQLAQFVVIYSPLQMASDTPENYRDKKAFDFIKDVPADWHESHVIDAVIGDYIVTARKDRNSEDWYLGAITDEAARTLKVNLTFLEEGAKYLAQVYADGDDADWKSNPTSFKYYEIEVGSNDSLEMALATSGGCAVRFVKL